MASEAIYEHLTWLTRSRLAIPLADGTVHTGTLDYAHDGVVGINDTTINPHYIVSVEERD